MVDEHSRAEMQRKLTITLSEEVYERLHTVIGRRRISRFIEALVRPHVIDTELDRAYQEMAADEAREAEALEWAEATIGDVSVNESITVTERRPAASAGRRAAGRSGCRRRRSARHR